MIYRNGNNLNRSSYNPISVRDDKNVNIEISYDNFDTVNIDMERKRQYAQDLRDQIEENERKRRAALEKKKLEDLEEELRLKREQDLIDQRQKEENKRYRPKINLPIQINGKLKANIQIALDESEESIKEKVHSAIENKLDGKNIVKEIYVKNRIYNIKKNL